MQNPDAALAASPLRLLDDDTFRTMCALLLPPMFIPSASFQGARPGYTFKLSHGRLGYHLDHVSSSLVAVALGRLGLTCRALLARTAPHALTMRLRRSMVDLALPVSSADKAPSVADIANAEAALHALREAGAQCPEDVEEATKQLAAAREWRRKACDLLGQGLAAALANTGETGVLRQRLVAALANRGETGVASNRVPMFIPSASFQGARPGYTFKLSHGLLGYHVDHVSSSLVTWLTSASVLDELYRLKGKFMRTSSPSESLEWDRYVVLHAPHERQELADMCLHSLAAIVLRVFKDLPSVAI